MSSLSIEAWVKPNPTAKSVPAGVIEFYISGDDKVRMEQAQEFLQTSTEKEVFLDVDYSTLALVPPQGFGEMTDCQLRVYLRAEDQRGQFHLVGRRAQDGALIYTNAMMIDMLT